MDILRRSADIIKEHQAPTGAYVASPAFADYMYSWFRDGAFIAHSMAVAGGMESALRFHRWASATINRYAWKVDRLKANMARKAPLDHDLLLHTRYTVSGDEVGLPWGNFQLDGYGAWLWGLCACLEMAGFDQLPEEFRAAADLAADYLILLWHVPCFDCWEEFGDKVHTSTLASILGGLRKVNRYLQREDIAQTMEAIRSALLDMKTPLGHFPKFAGTEEVDSSLIWLVTPFEVFDHDDPAVKLTLSRIEQDLRHGTALHRYRWDSYYGGGLWLPNTAYYGCYLADTGRIREAEATLEWMERQAAADGSLPEQVTERLLTPEEHTRWEAEKGPVASPLLWSHAMYIILRNTLDS